MEFVGTDTVPFRGLLELINMHKQELLKIVDVETLYSLDILQGKPCVIDGNFEFLSFNLNTAQGRRDRFLAGKTTWVAATSPACRCHQVLFCKSRQDCSLAGLTSSSSPGTKQTFERHIFFFHLSWYSPVQQTQGLLVLVQGYKQIMARKFDTGTAVDPPLCLTIKQH